MAGSINIKEINSVWKEYPKYSSIKCFIETGTYKGGTIFHMSSFFDRLYTIELFEKHYKNAIINANKKNINNIKFYFGDSSIILGSLSAEIKEPSVFFLDGHFCGSNSRSVSAKNSFPLFQELKAINDTRSYEDMIIIDDYRLFGKKIENKDLDWTNVTKENILNCFSDEKILISFDRNDRFYILIKGT